jgi:group II intron reverse transcriptase/maturase
MAVKLIIEPLFEADFLDCSLGFRPLRNNKEAAQLVHRYSNTHKWVVDVDLKSYFDTIDHDALMELVKRRVSDKRTLWLIKQWLKAGILEDGIVTTPERGTPQGGVLSPLLSNIYLNEIDKLWHGNASVKLVRFADDMVLLCKSETQARWVLKTLTRQLEALKLTLNEEKTKIRHVRETFDFVGFTYRESFSKKQGRLIRIKYPRAKSMQKIRDKIKTAVKEIPTGKELSEVITVVNRKLRGWAEYFKIGNSYEAALEITEFACKQLRIFWRRHKNRKEQQCSRIWQNKFFYERGLLYVPYLLKN